MLGNLLPLPPRIEIALVAVGNAADALEFIVGLEALGLDVDQPGARLHFVRNGPPQFGGEMVVPLEAGEDNDVVVLLQLLGKPALGGLEGEDRAVPVVEPLLVQGGEELDVVELQFQALPQLNDLAAVAVIAQDQGADRPAEVRLGPFHVGGLNLGG